jgi:exonuclease SbcC
VRLHRLRVTAFGPFARTEEVDFDELAAAGLYLIHGATGAGKTSVLDAICFALYAAVPGARAESRRSLHSDHAPAGAVPEVVLELTAAGRRLRITRSPEFDRPKLRGTGTTSVQAKVVLEELVRGEWVPRATRNDEAALIIHDVVGMGLEQFAKVVLLPQGDFAAFLRASPEQRREVLERLFDTQRFTDIEQWLADRRRAAVAAVADARAELEVALVRVQDVLAGLPASAAAAGAPAPGAAPEAGLGEWPGWADLVASDVPEAIEHVHAAVAAHAGEALAAAELAQGRHDSAAADLQRARVLVEHQRTAAAARGVLRALADGRDAYDEAAGQVAAAERALAVGGHLAALEQAELDLTQALATVATRRRDAADRLPPATHPDLDAPAEVSRLLDLLEARQGPLDELGSCASTVTAQEAEAASHDAAATQLEDGVASTLGRQAQLAAELEAAEEEHTVAQGRAAAVAGHRAAVTSLARAATLLDEQDRGRALVARLDADLGDSTAAAAGAEATALSLRLARLHGMAGELARGLVDGDACPVCGSCEHPRPAEQSALVTAEDIEAAEAAATVAMSARGALQTRLASARATEEARAAELSTLLSDREPSRVGADLAQARKLLQQAEDAASALPALTGRLVRLRSERDTLGQSVDQQRQAIATAVSRAEAARVQAARAAQTLAHGLGEHAALCPCSGGVAAISTGSDVLSDAAGAAVVGDHREVVATHRAATRALRTLADAAAALATARRSAATTQTRLDTALGEAGFTDAAAARAAMLPTSELSRMSAQLRSLDTQRDQAEALLAQPDVAAAEQQPAPDLDALAGAAVAARDAATHSRRAQALAESADRRIHELRDEVLAIVARIGPAEAEQAVVQELADCVGGTSGNNTLRMRLSSYLLAARLEEVARLANERLQVMTEGRYSLVYSDALARRGARSGLGLRVVDAWTGVSRETSTLSGGESFMASLALALGLGDAVRAEAGGFDLQTLFVDEGFGTLDDESLEQVMGVLDSLREGGRSVGIVSHVSELRQRIPAQLRVTKTQAGSTIDVIASAVAEVA